MAVGHVSSFFFLLLFFSRKSLYWICLLAYFVWSFYWMFVRIRKSRKSILFNCILSSRSLNLIGQFVVDRARNNKPEMLTDSNVFIVRCSFDNILGHYGLFGHMRRKEIAIHWNRNTIQSSHTYFRFRINLSNKWNYTT